MNQKRKITASRLTSFAIPAIKHTINDVVDEVRTDPEEAFDLLYIHSRGRRRGKRALRIDVTAQQDLKRKIRKAFPGIAVYGEESPPPPGWDLFSRRQIFAVVDAIDGTDLLERGFSNWCSAIVFVNPRNLRGKRIMAAFVGLPSKELYAATNARDGAYVWRRSKRFPVAGPSSRKSLRQASICFYGQKIENFLSAADGSFVTHLRTLARKNGNDMRIYDLAGAPMMMKLADHRVRNAGGVDAVFDVKGQKPHDFVPGAFIAKKAGAIIRYRNGKEISYEDLEDSLRDFDTRTKYVIACTRKLSDELLKVIR